MTNDAMTFLICLFGVIGVWCSIESAIKSSRRAQLEKAQLRKLKREAINKKLDAAFIKCPAAEPNRKVFYDLLLTYFDEHGCLPDFSLVKNKESDNE